MKIRKGFVSNSSSSSYIVVVPKSRKIDIAKYWKMFGEDSCLEDLDVEDVVKQTQKFLDKLSNGEEIWEREVDDEWGTNIYFIYCILNEEELIIVDLDAQPNCTVIYPLSENQLDRAREFFNEDKK